VAGSPDIVVVGSVNLDLAARVSRLPVPGETVTGAELQRFPGGKGANQALAARRLGANVSLVACVGNDANADEALQLLRDGGVDLSHCRVCERLPTGLAMICISPDGENQIIVAPGANRSLTPDSLSVPKADALICQLEVPVDTLAYLAIRFEGLMCVNLAPAAEVPDELIRRADLIVVNETEAAFYGFALGRCDGIVITTLGAKGAVASRAGKVIASAESPTVDVVDTTGAGDTFTAAVTVALAQGRPIEDALAFACAAGALATTKPGAQPSLPTLAEVEAMLR